MRPLASELIVNGRFTPLIKKDVIEADSGWPAAMQSKNTQKPFTARQFHAATFLCFAGKRALAPVERQILASLMLPRSTFADRRQVAFQLAGEKASPVEKGLRTYPLKNPRG